MYCLSDENLVTRGPKEANSVFPQEQQFRICYFIVNSDFLEHNYRE